jgi:mRNA-degrading endonuclease RelE of RelBE toxin-antitoxin system
LDARGDALFARIDDGFWRWPISHVPPGCKKLRGFKDQWRIRSGDWRVVYIIDDAAKLVRINCIAHRREIYER